MMKAGKRRKVRRIQEALDRQRHENSFAEVARQLGVSLNLVWSTAHGRANNRRVLSRFLELGVKPEDLDLPEHMQAELNNTTKEVA